MGRGGAYGLQRDRFILTRIHEKIRHMSIFAYSVCRQNHTMLHKSQSTAAWRRLRPKPRAPMNLYLLSLINRLSSWTLLNFWLMLKGPIVNKRGREENRKGDKETSSKKKKKRTENACQRCGRFLGNLMGSIGIGKRGK